MLHEMFVLISMSCNSKLEAEACRGNQILKQNVPCDLLATNMNALLQLKHVVTKYFPMDGLAPLKQFSLQQHKLTFIFSSFSDHKHLADLGRRQRNSLCNASIYLRPFSGAHA